MKSKEEIAARKKAWREKNIERINKREKEYRKKNANKINEQCKIYYNNNKEKIKKWKEDNKDKINEQQKEWRKRSKKYKTWVESNRDKINEQKKEWRKDNINYKITHCLRARASNAIKKGSGYKSGSSLDLLGCSWEQVMEHLESQFTKGMTWENHGQFGWHIDHIKPCDAFDLTDVTEQRKCFHWTNLQPLWWWENLKKGASWEEDYFEDLFE